LKYGVARTLGYLQGKLISLYSLKSIVLTRLTSNREELGKVKSYIILSDG